MLTKYKTKHEHYIAGRLPHHPDIASYLQLHYLPDKIVLELGAGTGMGTATLASCFSNVIAVEPVADMVEFAQVAVVQPNVIFMNTDVESLDANSLDYDYLICFQATHWFYETSNYKVLYANANQPVIDACSFISFPDDQAFFDELAAEHTVNGANRGTTYPFDVDEEYSYQHTISVDHAAHQLCSRSWVDHTNFERIRHSVATRYKNNDILVNINTRIHTVHIN